MENIFIHRKFSRDSGTKECWKLSIFRYKLILNFDLIKRKLDTVVGQLKPFNKCLNCCSLANIDTSLAQTPVYSDSNKMIRWITSMQDIRAENSTFLHSIWPNFSQNFYSHSKQVSVDEICNYIFIEFLLQRFLNKKNHICSQIQ